MGGPEAIEEAIEAVLGAIVVDFDAAGQPPDPTADEASFWRRTLVAARALLPYVKQLPQIHRS